MSLRIQIGSTCISWTFFTVALHHGCSMVSRACWWCYSKLLSASRPEAFHHTARINPKTGRDEWLKEKDESTGKEIPKLYPLPINLLALKKKSSESVLRDLQKIYNHQDEKTGLYTERDRFPNGPVLPVPVFIDSMSDFFHEQNSEDFQVEALRTMGDCGHKFHFQLLTKRTHRMAAFSKRHPFPDGVWAGTTCETTDKNHTGQNYIWNWDDKAKTKGHAVAVKGCPANWFDHNSDGIPPWERPLYLLEVNAKQLFLSIEPMTGPIEFPVSVWKEFARRGLWLIVGGESDGGDMSRPLIRLCDLRPELADLLKQCKEYGIRTWFKQWGSYDEHGLYLSGHKLAGHKVEGVNIYQWPQHLLDAQMKGRKQ